MLAKEEALFHLGFDFVHGKCMLLLLVVVEPPQDIELQILFRVEPYAVLPRKGGK